MISKNNYSHHLHNLKHCKKTWLLSVVFILLITLLKAEQAPVVLENDKIKAVFNTRNGALEQLIYKSTGWAIQDHSQWGLSFQLLVPLKERRDNPVYGNRQKLRSWHVSQNKDSIFFVWDNLESDYIKNLKIRLTGTVSIHEDGLIFNMGVQNKTPYIIEAISYPSLGEITQPSATENLERFSHNYQGADIGPLLPVFVGADGYYGVDHPSQTIPMNLSPFMLINSPRQGLYLGILDHAMKELVTCNFSLLPGYGITYHPFSHGELFRDAATHLQLQVWHLPFINPGEIYELVPILLNPYSGSWQQGVDNYKKWRQSWFKPPVLPGWINEVHSWLQLHINSPEEEWRIGYNDLIQYGSACAKNGVKAIQLVGWNNGGQDRGNPSHDTDPHLGTIAEFKTAISRIEKLGVKVILFNKYTWADRSTAWFRKELVKYAVKDPYGDYYVYNGYQYQTPTQLANINTRRLIPMCMQSPAWRKIADKEFEKNFLYGASGMLFDECFHHMPCYLCFDRSHGHHIPAYVYGGDAKLEKGFRSIADQRNRDFLFAGESTNDFQNLTYQVSYTRINATTHVPVMRYINSGLPIMIAVTGFNDRLTLNACLRYKYIISYEPYNFKGKLSDFPMTLEYGKKIDSLRQKYKSFLWDGEFRDTLGVTVTDSAGTRYKDYAVFIAKTGKKAAVIVNNDGGKNIELSVLMNDPATQIIIAGPENREGILTGSKIKVPALSAVVVMEQ
jgi:hypothetical protein